MNSDCTESARSSCEILLPFEDSHESDRITKIALDIGGTLTKVVCLIEEHTSSTNSSEITTKSQLDHEPDHLKLNCFNFQTRSIESALESIQKKMLFTSQSNSHNIHVTGGGAYKYKDLIERTLGIRVSKDDEMAALITGSSFLINKVKNECFRFKKGNPCPYDFVDFRGENVYPYLLVNIGSGVSIIKVNSSESFERVGGTSMGGGTFLGMGSLLTGTSDFDELIELSRTGEHQNIDLLVGDIYGKGAYEQVGLAANVIASSFAKAAKSANPYSSYPIHSKSDLAKSLLHMICNGIGQIASFHAIVQGISKIFFGGFFISGHHATMHSITFAVNYFSKGTQECLFFKHEGYLGAIGAFLISQKESRERRSFDSSSSYVSRLTDTICPWAQESLPKLDALSLECSMGQIKKFPLVTLTSQDELVLKPLTKTTLSYWLNYFQETIFLLETHDFLECHEFPKMKAAMKEYGNKFVDTLQNLLKSDENQISTMTLQSLLDMREKFLIDESLPNLFLKIKRMDNHEALKILEKCSFQLDSISESDRFERMSFIMKHLFAGGMFDIGANESVSLRLNKTLNLDSAFTTAEERFGKVRNSEDFIHWVNDIYCGKFKKAMIFLELSGYNAVLGIMMLVRELLRQNIMVILVANSSPSLNDVIVSELHLLVERVSCVCSDIRSSYLKNQLVLLETGYGTPTLDLRMLDANLVDTCNDSDLVIIQGSRRYLLSNQMTELNCCSLKFATVTMEYIAQQFNVKLFDPIFVYTPSN